MKNRILVASCLLALGLGTACSSGPEVKKQGYAPLPNVRDFETEFPELWAAIEWTVREYPVTERDPEKVGPLEMRKLEKRTIRTDWIYTQSRDKYQEYRINGLPKRKPLGAKVKFEIVATRKVGGIQVAIKTEEEVDTVKPDGSSDGYRKVDADTSRASELLDKIAQALRFKAGDPTENKEEE